MNIDEMKSNWQSAKGDINHGSELQPGRGRKTALQRLGDQYSRFSKFSLVFMLVSPLMLWIAGIRALWIVAGFALFLGAGGYIRWLIGSSYAVTVVIGVLIPENNSKTGFADLPACLMA